MDLWHVVFETEYKYVADAIFLNLMDNCEFESIIVEYCHFLSQEFTYQVQFVIRQMNVVAHTLAKAVNSYVYLCV